ncbi:hypothetical protein LCGC14_0698940 [marine sediment metagenome]|uniref:Uncharacterized protein n=1 Tax=marine sediment metagenome TaxID=412755 RepID=A0A0F9QIH2_9ZZZZ
MNTLDYFSQPDEPCAPFCVVYILKMPSSRGVFVTDKLVQLTGRSRATLEQAFRNLPSSFRITAWRRNPVLAYLRRCHVLCDMTFETLTGDLYYRLTGRTCLNESTEPLWCELAFTC